MKTAEDILKVKGNEIHAVSPETTVADALRAMQAHRIGAILIRKEGDIVGIWTERDLMKNTLEAGFDPHGDPISKYMVTALKYAPATATVYQLQDKFLGIRLRHLLIEQKKRCVGIISSGDVMRMILNDTQEQLAEANTLASWEYYENWRWR